MIDWWIDGLKSAKKNRNKRPMDNITHPRSRSYRDQNSMIITIRNLIPVILYLNNLNPFLSMDNLCNLVWLNLTRWFWWFWRRIFLKVNVFLLFHNYISLWKGFPFELHVFESSSSNDALCQVKLKLTQCFFLEDF